MTSEYIEIPIDDGAAEAYVARPETAPGGPGVLFYMDAFGLRPQIERMADRIASWGYVVLAPHVFHREGRISEVAPTTDLRAPGSRAELMAAIGPRMANHTPERAARDLDSYASTLLGLAGVQGDHFGVTGYCMGGGLALRAGAQLPGRIAAIGMFHAGRLVTDAQDSPHRGVNRLSAEVVAGHADNDASMPPDAIDALDAAFAQAGVRATTAVYEGAAHGYTMADTSAYDEAAAERHFNELRALFARTLT